MIKIRRNYSINFDKNIRKKNEIKFVVFHYTGMKSEKLAIKRLSDKNSKVSCHYFIKKNGSIVNMVPDRYISWHAGVSFWKALKRINRYSIGIEIQNPGHEFNYKNFNNRQIKSIIFLSKKLLKIYNLKKKNFLGHSDISPNRKKDPGEKFPWEKLSNHKIGIWHSLNKRLLKKMRLKKIDKYEEFIFLSHLKKIGYCFKNKPKNKLFVFKAFQRRFRPQLVNGKIDLECLEIAKNLIKSGFN